MGRAGRPTPFHRRDNPVREDRSAGPWTIPACRINPCLPIRDLAFAGCSRVIGPSGKPVRRDTSVSQATVRCKTHVNERFIMSCS